MKTTINSSLKIRESPNIGLDHFYESIQFIRLNVRSDSQRESSYKVKSRVQVQVIVAQTQLDTLLLKSTQKSNSGMSLLLDLK
jgi:hypothetical protein